MDTPKFVERARAVHGDKYDYSRVVYKNDSTKVEIICPEHGSFFMRSSCVAARSVPAIHKVGNLGSAANAPTTAQFIEEARAIHGSKYDYSRVDYTGALEKVEIVCPEHGSFWQQTVSHVTVGVGCPMCAGRVRLTTEEFVRRAREIHGDRYDYSQVVYDGWDKRVTIICPVHGAFDQLANNHVHSASNCPKCSATSVVSSHEHKLAAVFPEAKQSDRTVLGGKEIDLLITPTLGVEVNGRYWHTEAREKSSTYHLRKTEDAARKGVRLLQFWDNEVRDNFDLVCSVIRAKAGVSPKRVYARKCDVRDVSVSEATEFLNGNHLQGAAAASVRYGLYFYNRLVALMTFAKPRFSKDYGWELVRFCTLRDTQVVGGAGKLFKHFLRQHGGSVVSYANRRWSDGGLYKALGFVADGTSRPSYEWYKDGVTRKRYACQKHKLAALLGDNFDPDLSEKENMEAAGYSRLWDCGTLVFCFKR